MNIEMLNECKKRRAQLATLAPDSALILFSGSEGYLDRFRAASNFVYFTGFTEPDAVAVIRPSEEDSLVLFVRPRDPAIEVWDGPRAGTEGAQKVYGANRAFTLSELSTNLGGLLTPVKQIFYFLGPHQELDKTVLQAVDEAKSKDRRAGKPRSPIRDPHEVVADLRVVKSPFEIKLMRESCRISAHGHQLAMQYCRPGLNEIQIYSHLVAGFYGQQAEREGYSAIVGSGPNATILHYRANNRQLGDGELLLVDAGAEKNFYTADITRTFPVNGKFSPAQREVYQAVLAVQKTLIASLKPNQLGLPDLQTRACELITTKLIDLGLLTGSQEENLAKGTYKKFYPHGVGHYLGMDVHDVGRQKQDDKIIPLQAGMVITVEPGIYISPTDDSVPPEFRGIGVRIEDDVLMTTIGHEVLTAGIGKEIVALEELVGSLA